MFDCLIIGGGPAGVSAALYARRAGLEVGIITKGNMTLEKVGRIDNYYGFPQGITGKQLYLNGLEQARGLGVEIIEDEVVDISFYNETTYNVETFKEGIVNGKYLVLATGSPRKTIDVPGLHEFEGKGISYCATCDGFFFKDKIVAVIGTGDYAKSEAKYLENIAKSVKVLDENDIDSFLGKDGKLASIQMTNGDVLEVDGAFIAIGTASSIDLARKIGMQVENNKIIVDENGKTTAPNLYACGDCTPGLMQVCSAVHEGAVVGLAIAKEFQK